MDLVVKGDQNPAASACRIGSDPDGIQDIRPGIGAEAACRPLCPGNHNRQVTRHGQIQKISSLFERRRTMGYNDAAAAFGNKQLDAFWLFTAFPSGAVIMAAQTNDIELVNLDADAEASGFYKKYPYFGKLAVPAGTYRGVDYDAGGFQDSALWVANSKVSDDTVYNLLSLVYSDEGLKHMYGQKKTFKNMSLKTGATNIVTPFHPGAEKFWKEKGMLK